MSVEDHHRDVGELAALVALVRTRPDKLTSERITDEVLEAGSARAVWEAHRPQHLLADETDAGLDAATVEVRSWQSRGLRLVSILDGDYPVRLRGVHDAPPFVFVAGALRHDELGVSVVGSRAAFPRALQIAGACAELLVHLDLAVISGLAVGVDATAHRAALDVGGRVIGVIANGIAAPGYPLENRALQAEVATKGVLLSQFWPDDHPQRWTFVHRNATMSGLGLATIIVAAAEQSGARHQARFAVEHGRPVMLTDDVVAATTWGKDLLGQPGVHVVSGVSDVEAVLAGLRRDQQMLTRIGELAGQ